MPNIDDAQINSIQFNDRSDDPDSPAAGRIRFFYRAGLPFFKMPDGSIHLMSSLNISQAPLMQNLVSYWGLDEIVGTRYDAHNQNHLTPSGSPVYAPGKKGNALDVPSGDYLSIADNASLSIGDADAQLAAWVNVDSLSMAGNGYIFSKWGSGTDEYNLYFQDAGDLLALAVYNPAGELNYIGATTFGALSTATWYFVSAYHDSVNNLLGISINNGAFNTVAHSTGIRDGANAFRLGGSTFDGRIDEVGFWKRRLTANELTFLYNAGNGRSYAELATFTG